MKINNMYYRVNRGQDCSGSGVSDVPAYVQWHEMGIGPSNQASRCMLLLWLRVLFDNADLASKFYCYAQPHPNVRWIDLIGVGQWHRAKPFGVKYRSKCFSPP